MSTRNSYIDFLRCVGLLLIVIAHIKAPFTIHQLRCCDVPLMVFVSGLAYGGKNVEASWSDFFWPRIKRLLIPIYIFIICDLLAFLATKHPLSWQGVIKSFLLCTDGAFGYVWVMKVFLLVMLATPLLTKLCNNLSTSTYFIVIIALFFIQEILVRLSSNITHPFLHSLYVETIPYWVGYSIPFMIGLKLRKATTKSENTILVSIIVFALLSLVVFLKTIGTPIAITPFFKYPPHSYFITYGILVSVILWKLRPVLSPIAESRYIQFIGQNTIWIYIWHIVFVTILNQFHIHWIVKFCLVVVCAVGCYYIQYQIVSKNQRNHKNHILKYFVG